MSILIVIQAPSKYSDFDFLATSMPNLVLASRNEHSCYHNFQLNRLQRKVTAIWEDVCDALNEAGYVAFAYDLKHALVNTDITNACFILLHKCAY